MRRLRRSIARARMIKAGYIRINKPPVRGTKSPFADKWRSFVQEPIPEFDKYGNEIKNKKTPVKKTNNKQVINKSREESRINNILRMLRGGRVYRR